jgi:hypothetical protein
MPIKMIKTITVTGADDSVNDIESLYEIAAEYPAVEWGILLSKSSSGRPRFPSTRWINKLTDKYFENRGVLSLSAHLCGRWVRDIFLEGKSEVFNMIPMEIFKRIQFNFHSQKHLINTNVAIELLKTKFIGCDFIFQFDGVNDSLIEICRKSGIRAYPLFDQSGGAGIIPNDWPQASGYSGYAGGLSPDNVEHELTRIQEARNGNVIWIDAETKLRSEDDTLFDLDKVERFLKNAHPWTIGDIL